MNLITKQIYRIIGHSQKSKRSSATSMAEIFGPDGDLLVEADALLVNDPEEPLGVKNLDSLGWKVYPE